MSDWLNNLYFFNTILNIFSTSFTILFLLYRFTSLFTYIVGFLKFCGKLFKGIIYLKNKIVNYLYPNDYTNIKYETNYNRDLENNYTTDGYTYTYTNTDDSTNRHLDSIYDDENNKSFFTKCKNNIYKWLFPKKKQYNVLPVYETRTSYINSESTYSDSNKQTPEQMEARIINQHLYHLALDDNDSDEDELTESIPLLHQNTNLQKHNTVDNQIQNLDKYLLYNPISGRPEQHNYESPEQHNHEITEYQGNDLVNQFNNLSLT